VESLHAWKYAAACTLVWPVVFAEVGSAPKTRATEFECRFAQGPIQLDGILDEAAWCALFLMSC
jgi:hypothetical protein